MRKLVATLLLVMPTFLGAALAQDETIAPVVVVRENEENWSWQPLTEDDLLAIATGGELVVRQRDQDPIEDLLVGLSEMNLGHGSRDLPVACSVYTDSLERFQTAERQLRDALRQRALTLGPIQFGEPWFWPLIEEESELVGELAWELVRLAAPSAYLNGIEEALCQDLENPHYTIFGVSAGIVPWAPSLASGNCAGICPDDAIREAIYSNRLSEYYAMSRLASEYFYPSTLASAHFVENTEPNEGEDEDQHLGELNSDFVFQDNHLHVSLPEVFIPGALDPATALGYYFEGLRGFPFYEQTSWYPAPEVMPNSDSEVEFSPDEVAIELVENVESTSVWLPYDDQIGLQAALAIINQAQRGRRPSLTIDSVLSEFNNRDDGHPMLLGTWQNVRISDSQLEGWDFRNLEANSLILDDVSLSNFDLRYANLSEFRVSKATPVFGAQMLFLNNANILQARIDNLGATRLLASDYEGLLAGDTYPTVSAYRASIGAFRVRNSLLESLNAYEIEVEANVLLENIRLRQHLNFRGTNAQAFEIKDVRSAGFDGSSTELPQTYFDISYADLNILRVTGSVFGRITAGNLQTEGEFNLSDVNTGQLFLNRSNLGGLRITEGNLGTINVWGSQLGISLISPEHAEEFLGYYVQGEAIEFSNRGNDNRGAISIDRIVLAQGSFDNQVFVSEVRSNEIDLNRLNTPEITMTCTAVIGDILATALQTDDFYLNDVSADRVFMIDAYARVLAWYVPPSPEMVTDLDLDQDERRDFCEPGRVQFIDLSGSEFLSLSIGGHVEQLIRAVGMRTDTLFFNPGRFSIAEDAIMAFRNAQIETLGSPLSVFRASASFPRQLDLDGSRLGNIILSNEQLDGNIGVYEEDDNGRTVLVDPQRVVERSTEADYHRLFVDEFLPAVGYGADVRSEVGYRSAEYDLLRRSAELAGFPHLARDIAILQNQHYASVLASNGFLSWAGAGVYRTLGALNGYGYKIHRSLFILLSIFISGLVILAIEYVLDRRQNRARKVTSDEVVRRMVDAVFMSLDRTIPSLGVDEDYSRPTSSHMPRRRRTWVVALLYLQRTFAFVVVVALVGGIFDFFQ